jgi:hypothetical protein
LVSVAKSDLLDPLPSSSELTAPPIRRLNNAQDLYLFCAPKVGKNFHFCLSIICLLLLLLCLRLRFALVYGLCICTAHQIFPSFLFICFTYLLKLLQLNQSIQQ